MKKRLKNLTTHFLSFNIQGRECVITAEEDEYVCRLSLSITEGDSAKTHVVATDAVHYLLGSTTALYNGIKKMKKYAHEYIMLGPKEPEFEASNFPEVLSKMGFQKS